MVLKQFLLVGLMILTGAAACTKPSDSQSVPADPNKSVLDAPKEADRVAEEAKKAQAAAMDLTAAGGQPGTVVLAGTAWETSQPDPRVIVTHVSAGRGWRSSANPQVRAGAFRYEPQLSEATLRELALAKADKTFLKIGCDDEVFPAAAIAKRPDFEGLSEAPFVVDEKSPVFAVRAHSVILCGHSAKKPLAKKDVVMITAHSIYMNGFGHDMVGTAAKTFSLTSTNLAIDGGSGIYSKGENGPSTLLEGPSILIATQKIWSDGELRVGSDGADYVAAEKK